MAISSFCTVMFNQSYTFLMLFFALLVAFFFFFLWYVSCFLLLHASEQGEVIDVGVHIYLLLFLFNFFYLPNSCTLEAREGTKPLLSFLHVVLYQLVFEYGWIIPT